MLKITHPRLLPIVNEMPIGILPVCLGEEVAPILVVKAPKEYILAAKLNAGFKIYLAPIFIEKQSTVGAITAFFDDSDEPLTIITPLFLEDFSVDFFETVRAKKINVHFFDELSRERLAYNATVSTTDEQNMEMREVTLLKFSRPNARAMIDEIFHWFVQRITKDDEKAVNISLNKSIYSEDLYIQDLRPEMHSFNGSRGFSNTRLEIEEPGSYQEEDIIKCLLSVFPGCKIFHSPKRTYDKEEMCDILVVTDARVLVIQAKDTPNIGRISSQKLSRKRSNVLNAMRKAVSQVKGAIGYYRRRIETLEFLIDDEHYSVDIKGLQLNALIIVKELFSDQFNEYSPLLLDLVRDKNVPCIALDYPELYQYCAQLQGEEPFFNIYDVVMEYAMKHDEYPRIRFGLVEPDQ